MAKADDKSSTIDWIWLFDALREAKDHLGSQALAKRRMQEWLTTGQLPWTCVSWEGRDEPRREDEPLLGSLLSALICFWNAPSHWIDWDDNSAGENVTRGAQAMGILVSREHLLALLPEEPRKREQVSGGAWIAAEVGRMRAANKILPDIRITDFARELEKRMGKAAAHDKSLHPIKWKSIKNRLPEWGLWPVILIK